MAESNTNYSNSALHGFRSADMMTIPQIKKAKEILEQKIKTSDNATVTRKLNAILQDYESKERKINKFYQKCSRHKDPKVREFVRGKRNILRVIDIKRVSKDGSFKDINLRQKGEKWDYNAIDLLRDIKADKIALGLGVGAMGLGVASIKFGEKSLMDIIKKALTEFLATNPLSAGLLIGGASLIALSKVVPAIDKKVSQIKKTAYQSRMAQNEISEEMLKDESGFDKTFLGQNFENSKEKIVNDLFNHPNLRKYYENELNSPNLTSLEKINLMKALKETYGKIDDFNRLKEGKMSRSEEAQVEEIHRQNVQNHNLAISKIQELEQKLDKINLSNKAELSTIQENLAEISNLISTISDQDLKSDLSQSLLNTEKLFKKKMELISQEEKKLSEKQSSSITSDLNNLTSEISNINASTTSDVVENVSEKIEQIENQIQNVGDAEQRSKLEKALSETKEKLDNASKNIGIDNSKEEEKVSNKVLENDFEQSDLIESEIDNFEEQLSNVDLVNNPSQISKIDDSLISVQQKISALKSKEVRKNLQTKLDSVKKAVSKKKEELETYQKEQSIKTEIEEILKPFENSKPMPMGFGMTMGPKQLSIQEAEKLNTLANSITDESLKNSLKDRIKKYEPKKENNFNFSSIMKNYFEDIENMDSSEIINVGKKLENLESLIRKNNASQQIKDEFNKLDSAYILKRNELKNQTINPYISEINNSFSEVYDIISSLNQSNYSKKQPILEEKLNELENLINEADTSKSHFMTRVQNIKKFYKEKVSTFGVEAQINIKSNQMISSLNKLDIAKLEVSDIHQIDNYHNELSENLKNIEIELEIFKKEYGTKANYDYDKIKGLVEERKTTLNTSYITANEIKKATLNKEEEINNQAKNLVKKYLPNLKINLSSESILEVEQELKVIQSKINEITNDGEYTKLATSKIQRTTNIIDRCRARINEQINTKNVENILNNMRNLNDSILKIDAKNTDLNIINQYSREFKSLKDSFNKEPSNIDLTQQYQGLVSEIAQNLKQSKGQCHKNKNLEIIEDLDNIKSLIQKLPSDLKNLENNCSIINKKIDLVKNKVAKNPTIDNQFSNQIKLVASDLVIAEQSALEQRKIAEIYNEIDKDKIENLIEQFDEININDDKKHIDKLLQKYHSKLNSISTESPEKELLEGRVRSLETSFEQKLSQTKEQTLSMSQEFEINSNNTLNMINNLSLENFKEESVVIKENLSKLNKLSNVFKSNNSKTEKYSSIYKIFENKMNLLESISNELEIVDKSTDSIKNSINDLTELDKQSIGLIEKEISNFEALIPDLKNNESKKKAEEVSKEISTLFEKKKGELEKQKEFSSMQKKASALDDGIQKQIAKTELLINNLINNTDFENDLAIIKTDGKLDYSGLMVIGKELSTLEASIEKNKNNLGENYQAYLTKTQELNAKIVGYAEKVDKASEQGNLFKILGENSEIIRKNIFENIRPTKNFEDNAKEIQKQIDSLKNYILKSDNQDFKDKIQSLTDQLKSALDNCRNKAKEQEKQKTQTAEYSKTGEVSSANSKEEAYFTIFGKKYEDILDCNGYRRAVDSNTQKVNALASKIENEIVRIKGTVAGSKRNTIHINRETGEVYVDNDSTIREGNVNYPELSQLLHDFKKAVKTLNSLKVKLDETNKDILNQKYVEKKAIMRNKVASSLGISKEEASKLIDENGGLLGRAYSDPTLYNSSEIFKLQQEIREAKKEIENYINLPFDERKSKSVDILNNKVQEVKHIYQTMTKQLGKNGADKICAKTCAKLKEDIELMEQRLNTTINVNQSQKEEPKVEEPTPEKSTETQKTKTPEKSTETQKAETPEKKEEKEPANLTELKTIENGNKTKKKSASKVLKEGKENVDLNKLEELNKKLDIPQISFEKAFEELQNNVNNIVASFKSTINNPNHKDDTLIKQMEQIETLIKDTHTNNKEDREKLQNFKNEIQQKLRKIKIEAEEKKKQKEEVENAQTIPFSKDELKELFKRSVIDLKKAIELQDSNQHKEAVKDYKEIIAFAETHYGTDFVNELKSQKLDDIFEKQQNEKEKSSIDNFKNAISEIDTNSLEFKNFITKYKQIYSTLAKSRNTDAELQRFEQALKNVERNCTIKEKEVAKYLFEVAVSASAELRNSKSDVKENEPSKNVEESEMIENAIKKMIVDGLKKEEIAKIYKGKESQIEMLIKKHKQELKKQQQALEEELERSL